MATSPNPTTPPETVLSPSQIVTLAWQKGETMSAQMTAESNRLFGVALDNNDTAGMSPATLNFTPNVVEPNVHIPNQAEGAQFQVLDVIYDKIIDNLGGLFGEFMREYFPNETAAWQAAQEWIIHSIHNGGTGIKPNIEYQIYERDRARVIQDNNRTIREAVHGFTAQGFRMPPGALAGAVRDANRQASDKISQHSRDVAIKQAEMEVENVRFAVEQAITMRKAALDAARDYIGAMASGIAQTGQVLPSVTDSQSRLITAASSYYNARISAEDLRLRSVAPNAEYQQQANAKNLDAELQLIRNKIDAAIAAAEALARQAAAMLNALNVSTSSSWQAGQSVNASYSGEFSTDIPPFRY